MTDRPLAPPQPPRRRIPLFAWAALTLLAIFAWSWSYRSVGVLTHPTKPGDRWCVTSEMGLLVFEWHAPQAGGPEAGEPQPTWVYMYSHLPRRWPARWDWLGFDAYRTSFRHYLPLPAAAVYGLAVPHWLVALLLGTGLIRAAARWRRGRETDRRLAAGECAACGYDLRATPERCPECGAVACHPAPAPATIAQPTRAG